jgi:DNA-binding transcriptional LysR family regulator
MDFRHLGYFIAVAEERHFSRAAQRIGIEQSPLSRAIRSLERDLGVALLHRSTRGSSMTPAGEIFLIHARSMIEAAHCARRAIRAAAPADSGMPALGVR